MGLLGTTIFRKPPYGHLSENLHPWNINKIKLMQTKTWVKLIPCVFFTVPKDGDVHQPGKCMEKISKTSRYGSTVGTDQRLEYAKDCALDMRGTVKLIDFGMSKFLWWNVSGKFLEERSKCGHFVCLFCFCFGGRFLMECFIPFLLGRGETGSKGRWKVLEGWIKLDVVM